jgi:hypothetical protein
MHLIRRRVYLNEPDRDGQPVDSCIIDRDTRTSADRAAERATAVTTAQEVLDRKVLQTMRAHRPTSVAMVRQFVGARQNLVADAVGRVLDARLASKKGTRQPYQLPMPASRS